MKPPSRPRSAPARYRGPANQVWTNREKRRLLSALRAQAHGPLQLDLLKKRLPWRDETEILAFMHLLKDRVAREAVKAQYQYCQQKRKDAPVPAPIEVWMGLATKLTGCLEDAVTAAFSQVLTIASAEPLCLLHSVPPKPLDTKAPQSSSPTLHSESREFNEESQTAAISSNHEEELTPAKPDGFCVDFEKIYKYLSVLSRGSKAPELSPGESAVILDLLLSLPEELSFLDFKKLKSHMYKCYMDLTSQYTNEKSRQQQDSSQTANASGKKHNSIFNVHSSTGCLPPKQEGTNSMPSSKINTAEPPAWDWKALGICPLNSFLLPADILVLQKEKNANGDYTVQ